MTVPPPVGTDSGRPGTGELGTILVATDLGPASEDAVDQAIRLAARLRAGLLVVSVIDARLLRLPGRGFSARMDQVREERELAAAALVARARHVGVSVRSLVWEGDVGESILEAAVAEGANMIVVGTHGRGGVERFLLGSVSEYVVRHAPIPVLVVRPSTCGARARSGAAARRAPADSISPRN